MVVRGGARDSGYSRTHHRLKVQSQRKGYVVGARQDGRRLRQQKRDPQLRRCGDEFTIKTTTGIVVTCAIRRLDDKCT